MTSGGLGTMGYGMPASVGIQVAHPDALVINVAGEASWLMNMQEMGTAAQYRLPVTWRALFSQLVRGPARLCEAGRSLWCQGDPLHRSGRS